jgi:Helicase HerA-like C-terminal
VTTIPVLGDRTAGPWFRVASIPAGWPAGSAEQDYISVLPAALAAASQHRAFVAGWLCRGTGAPLELITNAAPAEPGPAGGLPAAEPSRPGALAAAEPAPAGGLPTAEPGRPGGMPAAEPPLAAGLPAAEPGRALLFPPGARGGPPGPGWLAAWDSLVWVLCPARPALPLAATPAAAGPGMPGGPGMSGPEPGPPALFESSLVAQLGRPFGWLVVAEPVGLPDAEIAELRTEVNVLRRHDEERARFGAERAAHRLAELDMFRDAGLWQVRVMAGAATAGELARLAPVLVGSAGLRHHPYRLVAGQLPVRLAAALRQRSADPVTGAQAPFPATAGVLAALCGLPRQEVPGVRVTGTGHFDLTSEVGTGEAEPGTGGRGVAEPGADEPGAAEPGAGLAGRGRDGQTMISLGAILDGLDRPVGEFAIPLPTLNRHALVAGATGAGKSQTVRHLLAQLSLAGLPWLVIEPVKSEYAAMAGRLAGAGAVTVINPADPAAIPFSVNPLAPEPGYPVQAHIDMVRALFLAAFDADEPFPQILSQALERVYRDCGWDVVTGGRVPGAAAGPVIPTLAQLQRAALAVIEEVGYGPQLRADVRGFVDVRLRSLRVGSAGRFFEGGHPGDVAALLRRNVVLAIEDVANDEDKAFVMGTLVVRVVEHLRLRARAGPVAGLGHVLVIEEAHRLLRAGREERASGHAVELFAGLLAEIRAYGVGLVIAEQIPAKLVADAVKNTALKVVHRLPAADDRALVGAAMNLDESQSRAVVSLLPGVAAVFADGMDRPVRVRVPYGAERERVLTGPGPVPPLAGRRSRACGPVCAGGRACTLLELRRAELAATAGAPGPVWLRLWAETLVLAFLTGRCLPAVPAGLARWWPGLGRRAGECLLASVLDQVVGVRALALRASYDPGALLAAVAAPARRLLAGGPGAGARPGPGWVIGQLRWLHEMERVSPLAGGGPGPADPAPPLEFALPGLGGWPGATAGQRVAALRSHPLSPELAANQWPAWTALLGEDDQAGFTADLATAAVGLPPGRQLRQVAGQLAAGDWLPAVLSWPRRFLAGHLPPDPAPAADPRRAPGRAGGQAEGG